MLSWVTEIIVGIISSLIAAILFVGVAALLSRAARWTLTGVLGRLLDVDIEMVFSSPREAAGDINKELLRSSRVSLLTGRGSELQRETFARFFRELSSSTAYSLRVLLPSPDQAGQSINWIARREEEVRLFDPAYGKGVLVSQIQTTMRYLEGFSDRPNVEVRVHLLPLIGRILLTDNCVYLTPYSRFGHSRESRVTKYRRGGDMYEFLERIFEETWVAYGPKTKDLECK
jgi:hypothetical protein